ncbi:MAG: Ldh family oxidoreductase [Candidatus Puniceispirillaceae bacterium]
MLISVDVITNWLSHIFCAANVPQKEAHLIATHLVDADASGHPSHGIVRVARYIDYLDKQMVRPVCQTKTIISSASLCLLDGQYSFGQILGHKVVSTAENLVSEHGIGLVGLRHAGHLGRIGAWAELLAQKGFVSVHFVTVTGSAIVAPFGAREAKISTAPVTIGIPGGASEDDFILDFATSRIAEGKILVSQKTGALLPHDAMVDEEGKDTDKPVTIYGDTVNEPAPNPSAGTGAIQTFGDHKGSGLGLACELLAGALTGSGTNAHDRPFCNGMLSIVFNPQTFDKDNQMQQEITDFIQSIRGAKPRIEGQKVLIPGDEERAKRAQIHAQGVPLDNTIIDDLTKLSHRFDVPVPL